MAILLMTNWTERSFDSATEVAKQVLTLSTGVVALSITFLSDIADNKSGAAVAALGYSWLAFILSVIFGICTLMSIAGVQAKPPGNDGPHIYASNLRVLGAVQLILFVVGMGLTALAARLAM